MRLVFTSLFALLLTSFSNNVYAQSTEKKTLPLNVEAGLEIGTQKDGKIPFGASLDCSYNIGRFSIHAVANADYFHPKDGQTSDFNRSRNLGGGLGFAIFPKDDTNFGTFELRTLVTTSVGSSNYNNTNYKAGIYWYSNSKERKVLPMVSVGYTFKDFRSKELSSYQGVYMSFGIRF